MNAPACTVLIVEDFLPDQELYRRYLREDSSCTYRFFTAESAKVALELCQSQVFDAILLDYLLPDADGLAFLEALHAQSNGNSPPVVMVTGQGDEGIAARAFKLGAEDYLVKGRLTPEVLQLTLRSAIENARLRMQLRQSENRFRTSVENMLDCFGIYTAIRDPSGQIIDFRIDYLNVAALECNGMTEADIGSGLCELLPAHRPSGLLAAYCRVVETGEPLVQENLIYTDVFGTQQLTRAFDIHASKLDDGLVISWRDVTARKQAELERQHQLERERIINQVTQQIRQSLDPVEVLRTAVTEVRQFLGGDRAFIYRFNPDFSGMIVVESVAEGWTSTLEAQIDDTCFMELRGEDYRQGRIQVVEDVYAAGLSDCHLEMLVQFQIRANLVVPILQGEGLWGLLVLNQCRDRRQWQPSEIQMLQQLAAQIGIALQQAELYQQVQQSQRFIQQISDAAPGFIYLYDLIEQRNVYINEQINDVLGYTTEEIKAMGDAVLPQLFHPDDFAQVGERIARLGRMPPGASIESEYRLRHKNGEWRWFFARETVYTYTRQGAPQQLLGVAQDVSERKRLEADRKRDEQRLRDFGAQLQLGVQVAGVALARVDYSLNRIALSPEAAVLYGLPPGQLFASRERLHATFHPDDRARLAQLINHTLAPEGDGWFADEHRVVWPTGEIRWLNVRKQIFFNGSATDPQPDYAILAAVDITDRKRAEATLRENEQRFKAIIDNSRAAIFLKDLQGRYLLMNRECERLFGITNEWICGKTDYDLFPPETAAVLRANDAQVLAAGEAVRLEETIPLADGIHTYVAVKFPLLDGEGVTYAICGISTDISDRVRLQTERDQLLLAAETARTEAEAANRSKDEFISMVAHELRSPLNAIMGWAKLLQTRQFDGVTISRALETIVRNAQAQLQLVEDLLDISRIVRGTLKLEFAAVNLKTILEGAVETMRPTAEAKGLQLQMQLGDTALARGDLNRLQQGVLNLLTNAIKFTPAGGRVEVKLAQVNEDQRHTAPGKGQTQGQTEPVASRAAPESTAFALISISDTGKGISPDFLPHVFERFSQDQQNPAAKQGLGLGLAIVKYVAEAHGGSVSVASGGEGQGATFTLKLPLSRTEKTAPDEADLDWASLESDALPLKGVRVLVVDDDPDMLNLTSFLLEEEGAVVQTANRVASALKHFSQFRPDLLLSDIAMPEQDGYALLQQVRQMGAKGQIPAIALTAYASHTRREESLRAGFEEHLSKPVEPEALVSVILKVMKHRE